MTANTIDPTSPSRHDKSEHPVAVRTSYSIRLTNFQMMTAPITIVPVMTTSPAASGMIHLHHEHQKSTFATG